MVRDPLSVAPHSLVAPPRHPGCYAAMRINECECDYHYHDVNVIIIITMCAYDDSVMCVRGVAHPCRAGDLFIYA
jgi:hypothetical protein